MQHGITEQDWTLYLNGALRGQRRQEIDLHLAGCPQCAAELSETQQWTRWLQVEGGILAQAMQSDSRQMEYLAGRCLRRIRETEPAPAPETWSVTQRLALLRFVMDPICGSGATNATMELAIRRSAGSRQALTDGNWDLFLRNLRETTTIICGLATGQLVGRAGSCLQFENSR